MSSTLAIAALLPLTAAWAAPVEDGPFVPGRVAPAFTEVTWHRARPADGVEVRQTVQSGERLVRRPDGDGYPAWYGFTVLVLALPDGVGAEALALGELAQRANDDRGLVVVTVSKAPPEPVAAPGSDDEEESEPAAAPTPFVPPSAELLAGTALESSPWCPDAAPRAIVLGPTGEVVGAVRLMSQQADLLALLEASFARHPAAPLAADLGEAVREAQVLYFEGDWDGARRAAEKLAKKLDRTDAEGAAAARLLGQRVDEHERSLRAALLDASGGINTAERLATLVAAIQRGFPRGKAADEAEAAAELQKKDFAREVPYRVAEAWVAALPDRPALFPEVADARGKKYAKRLEALTKMATFDGDLTRHAKGLLLRFELASRR